MKSPAQFRFLERVCEMITCQSPREVVRLSIGMFTRESESWCEGLIFFQLTLLSFSKELD